MNKMELLKIASEAKKIAEQNPTAENIAAAAAALDEYQTAVVYDHMYN